MGEQRYHANLKEGPSMVLPSLSPNHFVGTGPPTTQMNQPSCASNADPRNIILMFFLFSQQHCRRACL